MCVCARARARICKRVCFSACGSGVDLLSVCAQECTCVRVQLILCMRACVRALYFVQTSNKIICNSLAFSLSFIKNHTEMVLCDLFACFVVAIFVISVPLTPPPPNTHTLSFSFGIIVLFSLLFCQKVTLLKISLSLSLSLSCPDLTAISTGSHHYCVITGSHHYCVITGSHHYCVITGSHHYCVITGSHHYCTITGSHHFRHPELLVLASCSQISSRRIIVSLIPFMK